MPLQRERRGRNANLLYYLMNIDWAKLPDKMIFLLTGVSANRTNIATMANCIIIWSINISVAHHNSLLLSQNPRTFPQLHFSRRLTGVPSGYLWLVMGDSTEMEAVPLDSVQPFRKIPNCFWEVGKNIRQLLIFCRTVYR